MLAQFDEDGAVRFHDPQSPLRTALVAFFQQLALFGLIVGLMIQRNSVAYGITQNAFRFYSSCDHSLVDTDA